MFGKTHSCGCFILISRHGAGLFPTVARQRFEIELRSEPEKRQSASLFQGPDTPDAVCPSA